MADKTWLYNALNEPESRWGGKKLKTCVRWDIKVTWNDTSVGALAAGDPKKQENRSGKLLATFKNKGGHNNEQMAQVLLYLQ